MNNDEFQKELSSFIYFPEAVIQYAISVGEKQDDPGRANLFAKLKEVYDDLVPLEEDRITQLEAAFADIVSFKKTNMPKARKAVEASEKESALEEIEQQIES